MAWEVSLITWLQQSLGGFGEFFSKVFSTIGGEEFSLLVLLVFLFCWSKEAGKRSSVALLAASAWFPMIKNIVLRRRPYMDYADIRIYQVPEADVDPMDIIQQGYSFPSGHAAMTVAIYGSMALQKKKKWAWILAVVISLLVGVSRFVTGVHYPTDVLAGWVLGIAAIGFGILLEKKVSNENIRNLIVLLTVLPGIFWCRSRDYYSALGALIGLVIAIPYEKKYINFQDTRKIPVMILRVIGAAAIYFGLNTLLKLPFSSTYLNSGDLGANLIRSLRYGIILFVIFSVYPRCFPALEKLFDRKGKGSGE